MYFNTEYYIIKGRMKNQLKMRDKTFFIIDVS